MLKYIISVVLLIGVLSGFSQAHSIPTENHSFTIYLVRHAEKQLEQEDPKLTSCGLLRAENIAKQLEFINIEHIYSTNYRRTQETASPIAKQKNIQIESYDARKLTQFSHSLIANKKTAIVVGHSNTTAVLAGLLVTEQEEAFDESIYDRIYQVVFINGTPHSQVLQQGFKCP